MEAKLELFKVLNNLVLDKKYLLCVKCENWLSTPIYAHDNLNYCEPCSETLNFQGDLNQNLMLEDVLGQLKYPCKYPDCDFVGNEIKYRIHEKDCHHLFFDCLFCSGGDQFKEITIIDHLRSKHAQQIIELTCEKPMISLNIPNPNKDINNIYLIQLKDHVFMITLNVSQQLNFTFQIAKQVPDDNLSPENYNFFIQYANDTHITGVKGTVSNIKQIFCKNAPKFRMNLGLHVEVDEIVLKVFFCDYHLIQDIFEECPVCIDSLTPNISLCENSHAICKNCNRNISTCAICRLGMSKLNVDLRRFLKKISFPCPNRDKGCIQYVEANLMDIHTANCLYSKVSCIDCKEDCTVGVIFNHMKTNHRLLGNLQNYHFVVKETLGNLANVYVGYQYKMIQLSHSLVDEKGTRVLSNSVKLLYTQALEGQKYRYEVHLLDESNTKILSVGNICQNFNVNNHSSTIDWNFCKKYFYDVKENDVIEKRCNLRICIFELE